MVSQSVCGTGKVVKRFRSLWNSEFLLIFLLIINYFFDHHLFHVFSTLISFIDIKNNVCVRFIWLSVFLFSLINEDQEPTSI